VYGVSCLLNGLEFVDGLQHGKLDGVEPNLSLDLLVSVLLVFLIVASQG
jgi:hypothetical protein